MIADDRLFTTNFTALFVYSHVFGAPGGRPTVVSLEKDGYINISRIPQPHCRKWLDNASRTYCTNLCVFTAITVCRRITGASQQYEPQIFAPTTNFRRPRSRHAFRILAYSPPCGFLCSCRYRGRHDASEVKLTASRLFCRTVSVSD